MYQLQVTSSTYVNVLDNSVTSRTATSPGFVAHLYKAARGIQSTIKVRVWAYARGTGTQSIVFYGPTHVASNYAEFSVGAVAGWSGGAGYELYLNSEATNVDATTARNKIDVHGKSTGTLYIWALIAQYVYE